MSFGFPTGVKYILVLGITGAWADNAYISMGTGWLGLLANPEELVRATDFPFLKRYPALVLKNPKAEKEGIAGYEIALNYNGVAFSLLPRAASEIKGAAKFQLLSVNEAEYRAHPCRKLVVQRGSRWQLTEKGLRELDMLTY